MPTPHSDWSQRRFLIVEGDEEFRTWSEAVLKQTGATEVRSVPTCKEALTLQETFHASVVLIDFQLRDMHPVEFMRRLRNLQEDGSAETLLIPVAATADAAILRQACLVGIHSFIRKPTDTENFLQRVNGALTNPRRFVFGRRYFGPERRQKSVPFDGPDRRRPVPKPAAPLPTTQPGEPVEVAVPVEPATPTPPDAKPKAPTGNGKPAARTAQPKPATPAPTKETARDEKGPAAPPQVQDAADESKAELQEEKDEIPLIADQDVAASLVVEEPVVKLAIENHMEWLRSGGKDGERASLQGVDLQGADLSRVNLSNVNLREANLSDAVCRGINFQGADLRQADLSNTDITGGNLGVAKLRHSILKRTLLDGGNLRGADLAGAVFHGASLHDVDFSGANLLSTDFRKTDLSVTKGLTQVQFNKAVADATTSLPRGLRLPPKDE